MKLVDQKVYLEFREMVAAGISENTLFSAQYRSSTSWSFISDPSDKRKLLIHFEVLKDKYKELIRTKFGCPYKFMAAQIIKQHLTPCQADVDAITGFRFPDGSALPVNKQREYISACSYLNFLAQLSPPKIRALGYKSTKDFYDAIVQLIKGDNVPLPASYAFLLAKVRAYRAEGTTCIISKKWCNTNSLKVKGELCESMLLEMISHSNQFEDVFVARKYNKWAAENNYKTITDATVGIWRRKNALTITASREGHGAWHNQFGKQIHRMRPSAPLLLLNGDDNELDLFFRSKKTEFNRFTLYVITDAFNDYPLGYSISWNQNIEGTKAAFLNAIHHIHELTGQYMWWNQLQTDRWGLARSKQDGTKQKKTAFQMWLENQEPHFTPTRLKNARGKYIEQSFGQNWHAKLKEVAAVNYTGHNILAKSKPNFEVLRANTKNYPTVMEGIAQVEQFINKIRTDINDRTGMSKQQEWLEAFSTMPADKKKTLTDENRLLIYGVAHEYMNKLTSAGIITTINKQKQTYDIPQEDYIKHIGKTMQVLYDPYDLSSVLAITDEARTRILCPLYKKTAACLADTTEESRTLLNVYLDEQKIITQRALNAQVQRQETIKKSVNPLLLSGVALKHEKQIAEKKYYEQIDGDMEPVITQHYQEDNYDMRIRLEKESQQ